MTEPIPRDVLNRVRKLAQLPDEARHSRFAVSVTRLTLLKSLCQQTEVANRFVTYLAQRIRQKVEKKAKRPGHLSMEEWARHRQMIDHSVSALERYLHQPSETGRSKLRALDQELADEQNEYRRIYGGPVRIIKDNDLLLVEYALRTVLADEASVSQWAYQTARHYAERYDSGHGAGLTPASAPLLQDIADFWMREVGITDQELATPVRKRPTKKDGPPAARADKSATGRRKKARFTHRQGQFLAFIHLYRKLHRRGPAELDMVEYFRVTLPSVYSMIGKLEQMSLITREPGVPRSVRVAIPEEEIPSLEDVAGSPW